MTADPSPALLSETFDLNVIRCETALSRYPIHHLSKGKAVYIDIRRPDHSLLWQVSYSSKHGAPGPLAYKLDTLVVHRRIDETGRPVPSLLKLGSLREIADQLRMGADTNAIRLALLQNASPFITAKLTYRARDKSERTLEAAFTRYSVLFTGETLPDGRKADAVYLLLNDLYREVLNQALTRPLDYDYLRDLAPLAQRFYEIVSYPLYAAIKTRQRARLAYSELCLLSTMRRYYDHDRVKKQMYKLHRPHLRSGYLEKAVLEATVDEAGQPDWALIYTPGPKAQQDYRLFHRQAGGGPRRRGTARPLPASATGLHSPRPEVPGAPRRDTAEPAPLRPAPGEQLVRYFYETFSRSGKTARPTAKELAQAQDLLDRLGEAQARFLVVYAVREAPQTRYRPQTLGGILHYEARAVAQYMAQGQKQAQARFQKARKSHEKAHQGAYHEFLRGLLRGEWDAALPEAFLAFQVEEEGLLQFHTERAGKSPRSAAVVKTFAVEEERFRRFLSFLEAHPSGGVPSFWEWDAAHNPTPFVAPHPRGSR